MKRKVHIIYANFLKPDGNGMNIGGIETYIQNLSNVFYSLDFDIYIYQMAIMEFEKKFGNYNVIGVPNRNKYRFKYDIFNACARRCNKERDVIVFASEEYILRKDEYNTIGIQHGISWDIPTSSLSKLEYLKVYLHKAVRSWIRINRINKVKTMVCVDYNFINWFRALSAYPKTRLVAVPNFTVIPSENELNVKSSEFIDIIFARRFQPYRGTRIFALAASRILKEYPNVRITLAGEGPDEEYLKMLYSKEPRVSMIRYKSSESLSIHASKHIAVVPTIGSEGTSLSLLEAMAAGCAVIATNVGGMTNIILDHYNGLLINADEFSLYNALKELIDYQILRESLALKGRETAKCAFSIERWENSWKKIISDILR